MARAVVLYESLTGNTARAARMIAAEVEAAGWSVAVYPITSIGLKDLAEADVVFIGTWVDGLIVAGHRPGGAGRLRRMPVIDGKRVAAFMTYAVHAGKALERFAAVLEERGATVVSRMLLRRDHLDRGIADFVSATLATVPAGARQQPVSPAQPAAAAISAKTWPGHHAEIEEFLKAAPFQRVEDVPIGVTRPKRGYFEPGGPVVSAAWNAALISGSGSFANSSICSRSPTSAKNFFFCSMPSCISPKSASSVLELCSPSASVASSSTVLRYATIASITRSGIFSDGNSARSTARGAVLTLTLMPSSFSNRSR